jgi:hypothetical protein
MIPHQTQLGSLSSDEEIAQELERVAQMVRERPELNHQAADRLLDIARAIRADTARASRRSLSRRPKR